MWNDIFVNIFEDGFFAAIAAIGFSSISNTPRRAYLTCALIAAVGHAIRYVLTLPELGGAHIIIAGTVASFAIGRRAADAYRIAKNDEGYVLLYYVEQSE